MGACSSRVREQPPSPGGDEALYTGVHIGVLIALRIRAEGLRASAGPAHRGRQRRRQGEDLSVADVVLEIIRPLTRQRRGSYAQTMGSWAVGPATAYVIHPWDMPFVDLVDALEAADLDDHARVYLDFLMEPLWEPAPRQEPARWWTHELPAAILAIGCTVIVLRPWHRPAVLRRARSLFELAVAARTGAPLQVAVTAADLGALAQATGLELEAAIAAIDNATFASADGSLDSAHVATAVQAVFGSAAEAEEHLRRALLDRIAVVGMGAIEARGDDLELANVVGLVQHRLGRSNVAEPLLRRVLAGREKPGVPDEATLTAVNNLGVVLQTQGHVDVAETLFRRAHDGRRALLGPAAEGTLAAGTNLAGVFLDKGATAEATKLYRRAMDGHRQSQGAYDMRTLAATAGLAQALHDAGQLEEAGELYSQALEGYTATVGERHRDALHVLASMSALLLDLGDLAGAERESRRALGLRRAVLGDDDRGTLTSAHNLAAALHLQGRAAEAAAIFRDALHGRERALGPGHPDTLLTALALAAALHEAAEDEVDKAEVVVLYRRAATGLAAELGVDAAIAVEAQRCLDACLRGDASGRRARPDSA